jgi:hypothetical protein
VRFSPPGEAQTSGRSARSGQHPGVPAVTGHGGGGVHRKRSVNELAAALSDPGYVDAVLASDVNAIDE